MGYVAWTRTQENVSWGMCPQEAVLGISGFDDTLVNANEKST